MFDQDKYTTIRAGKLLSRALTSTSIIAMLSVTALSGVSAQDSSEISLEEVTVTAQRRSQSVIDVPISMTAFSATKIERANITSVEDYFAKTPNLFITDGASRGGLVSGSSLSLSIRGISNIGGNASSFGVYFDEVSTTNGIMNPHLVDVERIEILRGPQGTFYGRNASGGVMSIVTKKPEEGFYGEVQAGYANDETWDLTGIVNSEIVEGKFMLRGSMYLKSSKGFLNNVHPDHENGGNGYDYKNLRISARLLPSDNTTIDLMVNRTVENQEDLSLINTGEIDFLKGFCIACPVDIDVGFYPTQRTRFSHDNPLKVQSDYWLVNGRIEHDFGDVTFTSVTGFSTVDFFREGELDFSSVDFLVEPYEYVDYSSFSEELRLQSNDNGQSFHWIIGAIYAKDTRKEIEKIALGGDNSLAPFLPPHFVLEEGGTDQSTTTFAAFVEASYDVTDAFGVTFGGRFSSDKVKLTDTEDDGTVAGTGEVTFNDFSPKVALTYAMNDDFNIYVSAAKGWKSGGLQFRDNVATNQYDDESLWNYEIGLKGEFADGRARIAMAAFYIDWSNVQVSSAFIYAKDDGTLTSTSFTNNAASATSKGFEFELTALPFDSLEVTAGLGYTDAKFDRYEDAVIGGDQVDMSGKVLPRAPKWTANIGAEYSFEVNNDWNGYVRGEWHHVSELFSRVENIYKFSQPGGSKFLQVPSYSYWNFSVGFESEQYLIKAYTKNAFDQDYYTSSYDFGFANGIGLVPSHQVYGMRLTAKFY